MNVNDGTLRLISEISPDSMESFVEVPKEHNAEARALMECGQAVDFNGNTPLSAWGREQHYKSLGKGCEGVNRAERRRNAKKALAAQKVR